MLHSIHHKWVKLKQNQLTIPSSLGANINYGHAPLFFFNPMFQYLHLMCCVTSPKAPFDLIGFDYACIAKTCSLII